MLSRVEQLARLEIQQAQPHRPLGFPPMFPYFIIMSYFTQSQLPIYSGQSETRLQNSVKAEVRGSSSIFFFGKILYLAWGACCAQQRKGLEEAAEVLMDHAYKRLVRPRASI